MLFVVNRADKSSKINFLFKKKLNQDYFVTFPTMQSLNLRKKPAVKIKILISADNKHHRMTCATLHHVEKLTNILTSLVSPAAEMNNISTGL